MMSATAAAELAKVALLLVNTKVKNGQEQVASSFLRMTFSTCSKKPQLSLGHDSCHSKECLFSSCYNIIFHFVQA